MTHFDSWMDWIVCALSRGFLLRDKWDERGRKEMEGGEDKGNGVCLASLNELLDGLCGRVVKRPKFLGCCQIPASRYREPSRVDERVTEYGLLLGEPGHRREKTN